MSTSRCFAQFDSSGFNAVSFDAGGIACADLELRSIFGGTSWKCHMKKKPGTKLQCRIESTSRTLSKSMSVVSRQREAQIAEVSTGRETSCRGIFMAACRRHLVFPARCLLHAVGGACWKSRTPFLHCCYAAAVPAPCFGRSRRCLTAARLTYLSKFVERYGGRKPAAQSNPAPGNVNSTAFKARAGQRPLRTSC